MKSALRRPVEREVVNVIGEGVMLGSGVVLIEGSEDFRGFGFDGAERSLS